MYDILQTARNNWGWFLLAGVALILIGFIALGSAVYTTMFTVSFLGWLLVFAGVIEVIYAFWTVKWSGFFLSVVAGLFHLLVGALVLWNPVAAAAGLTLVISILFIATGLIKMIGSAVHRFREWGWVFFSGLISFILGAMILSEWPVSGLWVIGLFIGIDLIIYGWAWVLLAFGARQIPKA